MVVHGRSGSGKTTLLNVMGGLDRPDTGTITVGDRDLTAATYVELTKLRRTTVSDIFQGFGLLSVLTAAENVEVPLRLLTWTAEDRRHDWVAEVLEAGQLGGRGHHRPDQLSGGEQQRVAIARAIAAHPSLLIADEPTGQLDSRRTGETIMGLLHQLVVSQGLTAVVATHDNKVIGAADRRVESPTATSPSARPDASGTHRGAGRVGTSMQIDDALEFIRDKRNGILITLKSDGRPQSSNVLYRVGDDGVIRISVTASRAKSINLDRDPRATLHVSRDDFWAYAVIEGDVTQTPVAQPPDDAVGGSARRLLPLARRANTRTGTSTARPRSTRAAAWSNCDPPTPTACSAADVADGAWHHP